MGTEYLQRHAAFSEACPSVCNSPSWAGSTSGLHFRDQNWPQNSGLPIHAYNYSPGGWLAGPLLDHGHQEEEEESDIAPDTGGSM